MSTGAARRAAAVVVALLATTARAPAGQLLLNGGAGETPDFWRRFVAEAGGPAVPVVVLPTASERPEAGDEYVEELRRDWQLTDVVSVELRSRDDAFRPELVAAISRAKGVFFTGGDQSRITAALLGTPAMRAIREVFDRGGVLAGSSAGLACMSEVMITGEGDFDVLRRDAVETAPGLGFVRAAVLDQHFVTRRRLNRLISVVLEHPSLLGVGVDEQAAVAIDPNGRVEVLGEGSVVVVDARHADVRTVAEPRPRFGAAGVELRIYLPGDHFTLGPAGL